MNADKVRARLKEWRAIEDPRREMTGRFGQTQARVRDQAMPVLLAIADAALALTTTGTRECDYCSERATRMQHLRGSIGWVCDAHSDPMETETDDTKVNATGWRELRAALEALER